MQSFFSLLEKTLIFTYFILRLFKLYSLRNCQLSNLFKHNSSLMTWLMTKICAAPFVPCLRLISLRQYIPPAARHFSLSDLILTYIFLMSIFSDGTLYDGTAQTKPLSLSGSRCRLPIPTEVQNKIQFCPNKRSKKSHISFLWGPGLSIQKGLFQ